MNTKLELVSEMMRPHLHGREITDPVVHREMAKGCGGAFDGVLWQADSKGIHYGTCGELSRLVRWSQIDRLSQPALFDEEEL